MTFKQILLIFRARVWLILSLSTVILLVAAGFTSLLPKNYTATAAVLLDTQTPDPIAGMVLPGLYQPSYMSTQVDLFRSERVIQGAVEKFNLGSNAQLRESWASETGSAPGTFNSWLATKISEKLKAEPAKESNVINVAFSSQDPAYAAAMLNAIINSYIETTLELRVESAKRQKALFNQQVDAARVRLEQAQARLSDYQLRTGIVATDERLDIENARLVELSNQLALAQGAAAVAGGRTTAARGSFETSQDVINSPVVARLNSELALAEAKLKESLSNLGDAHPQVQQLRANIAELRQRVAAETAKVGSSIAQQSRATQNSESGIRVALESQRQRVLQMRAERDRASVLTKEVQSAQEAFDRLRSRLEQTYLESQSTLTNVSVVKQAVAPYKPSSPNLLFTILLAVVAGGIFSCTVAILLELIDRKLRSEDDVLMVIGIPHIGRLGDSTKANDGDGRHARRLASSSSSAKAGILRLSK